KVGTGLLAARPHAGSNEQSITGLYLQTSLLQPRLDVFDIDRSTGLEILHSPKLRNVDKDAAREDSILEVVNRVLCMGVGFLHLLGIRLVPVIEHAVIVDMRKRVEMSVCDSVERHANTISAKRQH